MIYCGSGSDFGKISVLVLDPDNIWHSFQEQQKFVQNLAFSMSEAPLFPTKLVFIFDFFDFLKILFYVGSVSTININPAPELEYINGFPFWFR
jgi:hypothetical protein